MSVKVLFVCLGNICRSPAGEEILRVMAAEKGVDVEVDSCGTGNWHVGSPPNPRMVRACKIRGYEPTGTARQITPEDLEKFDYVLVADENIYRELNHPNVYMITEHTTRAKVPDPYYGGDEGFDHVITLLEEACEKWLSHFESRK